METSWILDLVNSHLSYSDKVRIMSYHHCHQQESSVPNCNHHSPTSAQVPQPTRCPIHAQQRCSVCMSWSATQAAVIGATWIQSKSQELIFGATIVHYQSDFPRQKTGEYSPVPLRFPAMTLPNIILAPHWLKFFCVGFAGTEAHEYSGVCVYGLSMAFDHNYKSRKK